METLYRAELSQKDKLIDLLTAHGAPTELVTKIYDYINKFNNSNSSLNFEDFLSQAIEQICQIIDMSEHTMCQGDSNKSNIALMVIVNKINELVREVEASTGRNIAHIVLYQAVTAPYGTYGVRDIEKLYCTFSPRCPIASGHSVSSCQINPVGALRW